MKKTALILSAAIALPLTISIDANQQLKTMYDAHRNQPSDINQHLPILKDLAKECTSIIEIGVRDMVSTWSFLQGLSENNNQNRSLISIDLHYPPQDKLSLAQEIAKNLDISFSFLKNNDMDISIDTIPSADFLFIDSLHTYCHLTYELEKFSPKALKYIAMHDTSAPWGDKEDTEYSGDYSEYPAHYDKTKKGLWAAVETFLHNHPEWVLHKRYTNNHGLTVLKRIGC
jgi:hypothetical protein